jgi:TP901-1 family phage major tail protein
MAAQKGKDLLLKLDDGTGSFVTIAGMRTRRLSLNTQSVDITSAESVNRWRELLAGAGVLRASIAGAGVFKDDPADLIARQIFFDGVIRNWQITIPSFGIITGLFQIASLDYRGDHAGEITFDLALESAGALAFVAI